MTDLVRAVPVEVTPARGRTPLPVTADALALWQQQADWLAESDIVPAGYRNRPANIVAAALLGAELGWPVSRALLNIHTWMQPRREKRWDAATQSERWVTVAEDPVVAISSAAQVSLMLEAGHSYSVVAQSAREVTVIGQRCDRPCGGDQQHCPGDTARCTRCTIVTMQIDDKDLSHLVNRPIWRQRPARMLWWRAMTELVTIMCPEVLMGMTASPDDAPDHTPDITTAPDRPAPVAAVPAAPPAAAALPAAPPARVPQRRRNPKADAKHAVLAALDGDTDRAERCWADLTADGESWLRHRDITAAALDWANLNPQPQVEPSDSQPQVEGSPNPEVEVEGWPNGRKTEQKPARKTAKKPARKTAAKKTAPAADTTPATPGDEVWDDPPADEWVAPLGDQQTLT